MGSDADIYTAPSTGFAIVQISRNITGSSLTADILIVDGGIEYILDRIGIGTAQYLGVYVGPSQTIRYDIISGAGVGGEISVTGAEFT